MNNKLELLEFQRRLAEANNNQHRQIILEEKKARLIDEVIRETHIHDRMNDSRNPTCKNTYDRYIQNQDIPESECCQCRSKFKNAVELGNQFEKIYSEFIEHLQPVAQSDMNQTKAQIPNDILDSYNQFNLDHSGDNLTAFVIMQIKDTGFHREIYEVIKSTCNSLGIRALRADEKEYSEDLFTNVKTYMHACSFGIAVFERISEDDINPNVSLEVGYMLGLGKRVCLLKEKTLQKLQTDLAGKLYRPFDLQNIKITMKGELTKWINDKFIPSKGFG